jgi:hypothetical protein
MLRVPLMTAVAGKAALCGYSLRVLLRADFVEKGGLKTGVACDSVQRGRDRGLRL